VIALWIVLAVIVVALSVTVTGVATRSRRRRPVQEPAPPAAPAPTMAPEVPAAPVTLAVAAVPGAPEAPQEEAPPELPPSFRARLGKARGAFSGLRGLRARRAVEAAAWDELEETLLRADVGVATTDSLLADLRARVEAGDITGGDQLVDALRADLVELLDVVGDGNGGGRGLRFDGEAGTVDVWLFVGVNGVGKTTTVGKVARHQSASGRSVLLAAGDTFRAAAGEQLTQWATRTGSEIVRGAEGGDPSAIVFDAVQRAAARGNDLVLADTAGRLHTKVNLVEELKKIRRVADRPPGRVTEVLLVLDATTGQNALVQARQFTEAVAVTGLVLTKLDGTAKGGTVITVQRELGIPVKLVGLGEGPDDLVEFDPEQFVDALLGS
jgi:fused signal recognition particle receptor